MMGPLGWVSVQEMFIQHSFKPHRCFSFLKLYQFVSALLWPWPWGFKGHPHPQQTYMPQPRFQISTRSKFLICVATIYVCELVSNTYQYSIYSHLFPKYRYYPLFILASCMLCETVVQQQLFTQSVAEKKPLQAALLRLGENWIANWKAEPVSWVLEFQIIG